MRAALLALLLLSLGLGAAAWSTSGAPPNALVAVDAGEVEADRLDRDAVGRVTLDGALFTSTLVRHEADVLVERSGYVDGLRHGSTERFYPDGTPATSATYRAGRRDGAVRTWWADGTLRSEATYRDGVVHGTVREWYASGAPLKELRLVDGQEVGLQRAWRENGALYANYEARNGRTYGLKRANLCYEFDDESIVVGS
jgi:hypothetical protein